MTVAAGGRAERVPAGEITGDIFSVLGVPVQVGRPIVAADAGSRVAVVGSDYAVRVFGSDVDALGKTILVNGGPHVVVGVAGPRFSFSEDSRVCEMTFVVRSASDPASLATSARDAVRTVDPSLALEARTMSAVYAFYVNDPRLQGLVLGTIGAIAVFIAALGVYGVVSLMVMERRREVAIRTALGASRRAVMRLVLARGLSLATVASVRVCSWRSG